LLWNYLREFLEESGYVSYTLGVLLGARHIPKCFGQLAYEANHKLIMGSDEIDEDRYQLRLFVIEKVDNLRLPVADFLLGHPRKHNVPDRVDLTALLFIRKRRKRNPRNQR
jgi:hypothetical protein